ncbi:MAG: GtrA family protein [Coriobacteriia bacterium]|nr:GtrA family protein [Coriobacteriia bacterium]
MTVASRASDLAREHAEKLRFLVVGGWNTAFSMVALWVFEQLIPYGPSSALGALVGVTAAKQVVLLVAWVVAVTQNFFTFKLIVFRTKGNWVREYLRIYATYAGAFVLQSVMIQLLSAWLGWTLFWANVPTIAVVTVISYFGHKHFTFRESRSTSDPERLDVSE